LKVNILSENVKLGMVKSEGAAAWKNFLEYLVGEKNKRDQQ